MLHAIDVKNVFTFFNQATFFTFLILPTFFFITFETTETNWVCISNLTYEPVLEPGTRLLEPGYPDSILVYK